MKKTLLTVGIVALFIAMVAIPASAVPTTYWGVVKEVEIDEEEEWLTFTPICVLETNMDKVSPLLYILIVLGGSGSLLTEKSGPQTLQLSHLEIHRLSDHFIWITD